MTITRAVSTPQLSSVMEGTPLLTLTGASLNEAKNSQVELKKITQETLISKDAAYADLAKKACEATFKNKNSASLISNNPGADARYLQETAINLMLLKGMPGADASEVARLQKRLDSLGQTYCEYHQKHTSNGDFVPTCIAHNNIKDGRPYASQLLLTQAIDKLVKNTPNAHDHARSMLHSKYLKEGLVGSYQAFHRVTVDQTTADQISQHGNASSPANSTLAKQLLSAKLAGDSQSLTDTVLITLSQLDLQRQTVEPRESKKSSQWQPETRTDASADRRGSGDVNVNLSTGAVTQNVDLNGLGEAMLAQTKLIDKLLDMRSPQSVSDLLVTCQNTGVGGDSIDGQTHSKGTGTNFSGFTITTSDSTLRSVDRVESQVVTGVSDTFKPTRLALDIRQTLPHAVLSQSEQYDSLSEVTGAKTTGLLLEEQSVTTGIPGSPSRVNVSGSSGTAKNAVVETDSHDVDIQVSTDRQMSSESRKTAYGSDTGEMTGAGKQRPVGGAANPRAQEDFFAELKRTAAAPEESRKTAYDPDTSEMTGGGKQRPVGGAANPRAQEDFFAELKKTAAAPEESRKTAYGPDTSEMTGGGKQRPVGGAANPRAQEDFFAELKRTAAASEESRKNAYNSVTGEIIGRDKQRPVAGTVNPRVQENVTTELEEAMAASAKSRKTAYKSVTGEIIGRDKQRPVAGTVNPRVQENVTTELEKAMAASEESRKNAYNSVTGEIIGRDKQRPVAGTVNPRVQEDVERVETRGPQATLGLETSDSTIAAARPLEREMQVPLEESQRIQSRKFIDPTGQALNAELQASRVARANLAFNPISASLTASSPGSSSDTGVSLANRSTPTQKPLSTDIRQESMNQTLLDRIRGLRASVGGDNPFPLKSKLEDRLLKMERERSEAVADSANGAEIDKHE